MSKRTEKPLYVDIKNEYHEWLRDRSYLDRVDKKVIINKLLEEAKQLGKEFKDAVI